ESQSQEKRLTAQTPKLEGNGRFKACRQLAERDQSYGAEVVSADKPPLWKTQLLPKAMCREPSSRQGNDKVNNRDMANQDAHGPHSPPPVTWRLRLHTVS